MYTMCHIKKNAEKTISHVRNINNPNEKPVIFHLNGIYI